MGIEKDFLVAEPMNIWACGEYLSNIGKHEYLSNTGRSNYLSNISTGTRGKVIAKNKIIRE